MAPIEIYELCGADPQQVFSPYCWAARLALIHKKLDFTTIPWKFTEKDVIQKVSGQSLVPVIVDGEKVVNDSFAIAQYLEETYPDAPSLFGGPAGLAGIKFFMKYLASAVQPQLFPLMLMSIHNCLADDDKAYFRANREERLGKPLEEFLPEAERPAQLTKFRAALEPVRAVLEGQAFLGGEAPLYSDIVLYGAFLWAKAIDGTALLASDDPVYAWRERMDKAYPNLDGVWAEAEQ